MIFEVLLAGEHASHFFTNREFQQGAGLVNTGWFARGGPVTRTNRVRRPGPRPALGAGRQRPNSCPLL